MNTIKKIIFMSNTEKNSTGILRLEKKNNNIFGNIKIYNGNINGDYILGIKVKDKVIKQNVNVINNQYNFKLANDYDLDNTYGCVLIKIIDGEFKPILWGNEDSKNYKSNIISSLKFSINNISNSSIKSNNLDTHNSKTDNTSINTIDNEKLNNEEKNTLSLETSKEEFKETESNINYKSNSKIFSQNKVVSGDMVYRPFRKNKLNTLEELSQISIDEEIIDTNENNVAIASNPASLFETDNDELEQLIDLEINDNKTTNTLEFYSMIADQLQELFDRYPPEQNLNSLVENSYWAKIDTDIVNKHYVVGIIKDKNDEIKYICYGVPGNYNQQPPTEMKDYSQWLPTDVSDPYTKGYWVMYQDANTGENIMIN